MTFGLRNASQSFQRYINRVLGILVVSSLVEKHNEHLRLVFKRLEKYQLRLSVDKCNFAAREFEFLGYAINAKGIRPTTSKVEATMFFPKSKMVVDLMRFLGMVNFYPRNLP